MAIDGLASGLDTNNIIKQLMEIEKIPVTQMEARQAKAQAAADAYASISSKLGAISIAAYNLERSNDWTLSSATSSNLNTATAAVSNASLASTGTLNFRVQNVAAAHTITTAAVADRTTSMTTANPGSISLTVNGEATTLSVGTGTIDEVAGAINSAGLGIRATVVNVGSGFRLQMSSNKTGDASQFTVSGFAGAAPTMVTVEGKDATISIGEGANAYTISSSTNTFSDVMPGVTITAKAVSNDPVTVAVARDGKGLADRVKALATAVNDAMTEIKKQTAFDAATGKGSTLSGDSATRQATQTLTRAITDALASSPLYSGANIGLSVDRNGAVTFDETKFLAEYDKNPDAVSRMFTQGGTATQAGGAATSNVSFVGAGNRLAAGDYNVIVTQEATKASQIGMVGNYPITSPATIRVKMGSTEIVLAIGNGPTHDVDINAAGGSVSADAVVTALNSKLAAAKMGVTASKVTDGGQDGIQLNANNFGAANSFQVSWSDTVVPGIDDAPSTFVPNYVAATGLDAAGTINGQTAKGVGQMLSLDTTNGELSGISLNATATGSYTLSYAPGIAQRLLTAVSNATDSRFGYLTKAKEGRETQISNIKKSIEQYELRLDARELRLRAQFSALETALSGLTSAGSMLASMTSSLENSKSNR